MRLEMEIKTWGQFSREPIKIVEVAVKLLSVSPFHLIWAKRASAVTLLVWRKLLLVSRIASRIAAKIALNCIRIFPRSNN